MKHTFLTLMLAVFYLTAMAQSSTPTTQTMEFTSAAPDQIINTLSHGANTITMKDGSKWVLALGEHVGTFSDSQSPVSFNSTRGLKIGYGSKNCYKSATLSTTSLANTWVSKVDVVLYGNGSDDNQTIQMSVTVGDDARTTISTENYVLHNNQPTTVSLSNNSTAIKGSPFTLTFTQTGTYKPVFIKSITFTMSNVGTTTTKDFTMSVGVNEEGLKQVTEDLTRPYPIMTDIDGTSTRVGQLIFGATSAWRFNNGTYYSAKAKSQLADADDDAWKESTQYVYSQSNASVSAESGRTGDVTADNLPNQGAFYIYQPTVNSTITIHGLFRFNPGSKKKLWIVEADNASSTSGTGVSNGEITYAGGNVVNNDDGSYTFTGTGNFEPTTITYRAKAGKSHYFFIQSGEGIIASGIEVKGTITKVTQSAGTHIKDLVTHDNYYIVNPTDVQNYANDGTFIAAYEDPNRTNVHITFGTGFQSNADKGELNLQQSQTDAAEFDNFVARTVNYQPTTFDTKGIPNGGNFISFVPQVTGTAKLALHASQQSTIVFMKNGQIINTFNNPYDSYDFLTYAFTVEQNAHYYIYDTASGSDKEHLSLYGFYMKPNVSSDENHFIDNTTAPYVHQYFTLTRGENENKKKLIRMMYGGWMRYSNSLKNLRSATQTGKLDGDTSLFINNVKIIDQWVPAKMEDEVLTYTGIDYYTAGAGDELNGRMTNEATSLPRDEKGYLAKPGSSATIPCRGTYYKFEPYKEGYLYVYVRQDAFDDDATKQLYLVDEKGVGQIAVMTDSPVGNAMTQHDNGSLGYGYTVANTGQYCYAFQVEAGKTYTLFGRGYCLGYYGFNFDDFQDWPEYTLALDEKESYTNNFELHNVNVTLTRSLTANAWNPIVLPFSMTEEQVVDAFGDNTVLAKFEGTTHEDGKLKAKFVTHYYQTIESGIPYIIYPTKVSPNGVYTITGVVVDANEPVAQTFDGFSFKGFYGKSAYPKGCYFIASNKKGESNIYLASKDIAVGGTRAYIEPVTQQAKARRLNGIAWTVENDADSDQPTAIDNVVRYIRVNDNAVYNMQGQKVADKLEYSGNDLKRGVYISGGRKFIVK